MNIQEFRQKYPQYNDMDDDTLANTFYEKYYSDMPRQQFMLKFMSKPSVASAQTLTGTPVSPGMPTKVSELVDPSAAVKSFAEVLPPIGAVGGSFIGAGSPTPGGAAIGGALGYAGMKNLKRAIQGEPADISTATQDLTEGMTQEVLGWGLGKLASGVGRAGASIGKQFLGKTTGAGPGAIEEAVKGGEAFTKAMRGNISKEQVIGDAKDALRILKDERSLDYRNELAKLAKNAHLSIS